jgi:hypothetical protein
LNQGAKLVIVAYWYSLSASILGLSYVVPAKLASPSTILVVCPEGCPYSSIQVALGAARPSDTVLVRPGTYHEHVTLVPGVQVQGSGPGQSIIDGSGTPGPVVTAEDSAITSTTVLEGFTITGGNFIGAGGGVHILGTSPIISNNLIINNTAGFGGGIAVVGSASAQILNNTVQGNTATVALDPQGRDPGGGGIFIRFATVTIRGNIIVNNVAASSGGGIVMDEAIPDETTPSSLTDSVITENQAQGSDGFGGGVYLRHTHVFLRDNLVTQNNSRFGSGIYNAWTETEIGNTTVSDNNPAAGEGIRSTADAITLTNSIVTGHRWGIVGTDTQTYTSEYNLVWSNSQANYFGSISPGAGSISADPLFVIGPGGNYYLSQVAAGQSLDSPAVNAGSDTAAALGLSHRTTRTDQVGDRDRVDLGYHFAVLLTATTTPSPTPSTTVAPPTPSQTSTPSPTPSSSPTPSPTPSTTVAPPTPSQTSTPSPTSSLSTTPSPTPSTTVAPPTPRQTDTPSPTATPLPIATRSPSPTLPRPTATPDFNVSLPLVFRNATTNE